MKFHEIIQCVMYSDVLVALQRVYPSLTEAQNLGHIYVLQKLKTMPPEESLYILTCKWVEPHLLSEEGCWHVYGIDPDDDMWAIDFIPWAQWLDMECDYDANLTPAEFVAHCLYEMTYYGYNEEDVKGEFEKITKQVEAVQKEYGML